jgi:hypothetical protein
MSGHRVYFTVGLLPVLSIGNSLLLKRLSTTIAFLPLVLGLAACSTSVGRIDEDASADVKLACGQVCLRNGEACSDFFGKRNAETRLLFEEAKQNYWICLRKYPGSETKPNHPCIAPAPMPETFDDCGPRLDQCLTDCGTSLDEMSQLSRKLEDKQKPARQPPIPAD